MFPSGPGWPAESCGGDVAGGCLGGQSRWVRWCPTLARVLLCGLAERLGGDPVESAVAELADVVAERLQGPLTLDVVEASQS